MGKVFYDDFFGGMLEIPDIFYLGGGVAGGGVGVTCQARYFGGTEQMLEPSLRSRKKSEYPPLGDYPTPLETSLARSHSPAPTSFALR